MSVVSKEVGDKEKVLEDLHELEIFFDRAFGPSSSTLFEGVCVESKAQIIPPFSKFVFENSSLDQLIQSQNQIVEENFVLDDEDEDEDNVSQSDSFAGDDTVVHRSNVMKTSNGLGTTDKLFKNKCISKLTLYDAGALSCKCATSNCMQKMTIGQAKHTQDLFWGNDKKIFPSTNKRRNKITNLLKEAYDPIKSTFSFRVYDPLSEKYDLICEHAMVTLLFGATEGTTVCNLTTAPRGWREIKHKIKTGSSKDIDIKDVVYDSSHWAREKALRKRRKREYCEQYITSYCNNNCEASVLETGVKFLPFRSLNAFYSDYLLSLVLSEGDRYKSKLASLRTFQRAFADIQSVLLKNHENIRFMRSKGSFNTCEVCTTAADLLTTRRFSRVIRDLIGQYRK